MLTKEQLKQELEELAARIQITDGERILKSEAMMIISGENQRGVSYHDRSSHF